MIIFEVEIEPLGPRVPNGIPAEYESDSLATQPLCSPRCASLLPAPAPPRSCSMKRELAEEVSRDELRCRTRWRSLRPPPAARAPARRPCTPRPTPCHTGRQLGLQQLSRITASSHARNPSPARRTEPPRRSRSQTKSVLRSRVKRRPPCRTR